MSRGLDASLHLAFLMLAVVSWLLNRNRTLIREIQYIGWYLLVTFLFDSAAILIMLNRYLAKLLVSNLFLYHVLVPIQFSLIMLIYNSVLQNRTLKKLALAAIPVFAVLSLLFSLTLQPLNTYNSYAVLIKHSVAILFVLIYFYELLATTPFTTIYTKAIFWISIAFLLHSTFNILLEGFSNYLGTYSNSKYEIVFFLYSISNYLLFLILAVGLFVSNFTKSTGHASSLSKIPR